MSNMDDFNRCTALVLAHLYDAFPQEVHPFKLADLEPDLSENTAKNFAATVVFLAEEHFIVCGKATHDGMTLTHARLTSKGLATLKSIPEAIAGEEKTSFADKIKAVVKDGGKQSINTVISQTIAAFVKIAVF
ncbi:hypothetical protein [Methylobacter marinus]|uniref:hypothetical protein n=1 Tax=Methylobacter marinus TaxID=34058 RepID=UPI0003A4A26C|nr:hypothetical protein [Methylobacter marinus]